MFKNGYKGCSRWCSKMYIKEVEDGLRECILNREYMVAEKVY